MVILEKMLAQNIRGNGVSQDVLPNNLNQPPLDSSWYYVVCIAGRVADKLPGGCTIHVIERGKCNRCEIDNGSSYALSGAGL